MVREEALHSKSPGSARGVPSSLIPPYVLGLTPDRCASPEDSYSELAEEGEADGAPADASPCVPTAFSPMLVSVRPSDQRERRPIPVTMMYCMA